MLKDKEFEVLVALEKTNEALSQRKLSEITNLSLGTVNKVLQDFLQQGLYDGERITKKGIEALEPYRVKRAIFLAAGFGSRMVPITLNTPKPLVRVNGKRIIDTLLDAVQKAGIEEVVVVRGYLGEQFDQLLYKYKNINFVENPIFNESNNISSAVCVRYLFENAYVLESDLLLANPNLIRKYEYHSNFLGIPVDKTDDWCFEVDNGVITEQKIGGEKCYQMVGISYWNQEDGKKLSNDLNDVFTSPGGKERYWEQTALVYKKDNYKIHCRPCKFSDIVEIDTFNELKKIDKIYDI